MKKISIALLLSLLLPSFCVKAQDYSKIWKGGKFINIGYAINETKLEGSPVEKADYGVSLTTGHTYLFPKTPVAGMLKFGFDINWADVNFASYKNQGLGEFIPDDDLPDIANKVMNLGRKSLQLGAFGIGPNVSIAPLTSLGNQASYLKASLYFHYQPTVGAYLISENGDIEASWAYCNIFQFGGKLSWKFIGLGVEGVWGSGKFKPIGFDFGENDAITGELGLGGGGAKLKRQFANTRIYISFMF